MVNDPTMGRQHATQTGKGSCYAGRRADSATVVLTESRERLGEQFDVPGEILSFRSFDEFADLGRRAAAGLSRAERGALGDAASARAHRDHGYAARFGTVVKALGRG